jgi:hypothetical protein
VKLIRIEYILNNNNWKCNVIAKDTKDGVSFLEKYLRAPFSITSTEEVCDIHGISDTMKDNFLKTVEAKVETKSEPKSKLGRPKK